MKDPGTGMVRGKGRCRNWPLLAFVISAYASASVAALGSPVPVTCSMRNDLVSHRDLTWPVLRKACLQEQHRYIESHQQGYSWFSNAANGFSGFPFILQKVLPDLAPEIWGVPAEHFSRFGFIESTDSTNPLPQGLGIASAAGRPVDNENIPRAQIDFNQPSLHVVTLSCGACHIGQVRTPLGLTTFVGAPNTQIDVRKWREAYRRTVDKYLSTPSQINNTVKKLAEIIDSKPLGYFYPERYFMGPEWQNFSPSVEVMQRRIVKEHLISTLSLFACNIKNRAVGQDLQRDTSYGKWNTPGLAGFSSGQQDGSGDLVFQLLVDDPRRPNNCQIGPDGALTNRFDAKAFLLSPHSEVPPFATITDIPSVWNQGKHPVAQWDGSVNSAFWRNIAAALPIVGDPAKVDLHNVAVVANFLNDLPPPPYPFEVDMERAARGERLFVENCSVCHQSQNSSRLHQYRDIGTDMNRASVLNEAALKLFQAGFMASCSSQGFQYRTPAQQLTFPCRQSGNDVIVARVTPDKQGYVTNVLDGIWARAPYLHNGSVPTLYHLLVPSARPTMFLRGSPTFDEEKVGYTWQIAETGRVASDAPTLMVYDTTRDSHSNAGHDRNVIVDGQLRRLDWSGPQHWEELKDLIEYLKTR